MTVPIGRMSLLFGFLVMFVSCTWSRSCFHEVPCLRGGINCTGEWVVLVSSLKVLIKVVQSTCWSICRFWVLCLSSEFLFRVVQSTCWSLCRFWLLCLSLGFLFRVVQSTWLGVWRDRGYSWAPPCCRLGVVVNKVCPS